MSKTPLTLEMERAVWKHTKKTGVFGCFEVTIGNLGHERVDFLTLDTKGVWRCYEIKVTKQDFRSNAAQTFVGNYNYFVMPFDLYEQVAQDIPEGVGVYVPTRGIVKPPKRQELGAPVDLLYRSMIRSMSRDVDEAAKVRGENSSYFERLRIKLGERQRRMREEVRRLRERDSSYYHMIVQQRLKNAELRRNLYKVTGTSTRILERGINQ